MLAWPCGLIICAPQRPWAVGGGELGAAGGHGCNRLLRSASRSDAGGVPPPGPAPSLRPPGGLAWAGAGQAAPQAARLAEGREQPPVLVQLLALAEHLRDQPRVRDKHQLRAAKPIGDSLPGSAAARLRTHAGRLLHRSAAARVCRRRSGTGGACADACRPRARARAHLLPHGAHAEDGAVRVGPRGEDAVVVRVQDGCQRPAQQRGLLRPGQVPQHRPGAQRPARRASAGSAPRWRLALAAGCCWLLLQPPSGCAA